MGRLAGTAEAMAVIAKRVRAVPKMSETALERILRNLDAEEFALREAASKELGRLGAVAVPRVKTRLAEGGSAEMKKRLETFLAEHDGEDLPSDELRSLRAVEILEAIGTPAARKVLGELASGEPGARLTREAAGAVQRLGRR
jgi:hypothetical protein